MRRFVFMKFAFSYKSCDIGTPVFTDFLQYRSFFGVNGNCARQITKEAMLSLIRKKIGTLPSFLQVVGILNGFLV